MPARTTEESVQTSLRIHKHLLEWIKGEAEAKKVSYGFLINEALNNVRTYFGFPMEHVEILKRDAEKLGLGRAQHLQHIVGRYLVTLLREEAAAPASSPTGAHKKK